MRVWQSGIPCQSGRFSYNYCIMAFWLDRFGGVSVRTALRIVCMSCFVLVSFVVVDVFVAVASVGVVEPEGIADAGGIDWK